MRVMILGASSGQLDGISQAKQLGMEVAVCDYLPAAVGHQLADKSYYVSTFDRTAVLAACADFKPDGIMTLGTDQPVLTVADCAAKMGLPALISPEVALHLTNKFYMKQLFERAQIPSVSYHFFSREAKPLKSENISPAICANYQDEQILAAVKYPAVLKPVDSQGQRGIFYVQSKAEVLARYDQVVAQSRENIILIEDYYPNQEVTFSGWVEQGRLIPLAVTDRICFVEADKLGICLEHRFPSRQLVEKGQELLELSNRIVTAFAISSGPVYFQFLIGANGIKVNEVAGRIGGAYEALFIPRIDGFEIGRHLILESVKDQQNLLYQQSRQLLEQLLKLDQLADDRGYQRLCQAKPKVVVLLFFAKPGQIAYLSDLDWIRRQPGVIAAGYNVTVGQTIAAIDGGAARAGYAVLVGQSETEIYHRRQKLIDNLQIRDCQGQNQIIFSEQEMTIDETAK